MDKQIKILVDCSHVSIPYMGMIVYTIGLVKGLVEETNMKVAILISDKCSKYTREFIGGNVELIEINKWDRFWRRHTLLHKIIRSPFWYRLRKRDISVVLSPHLRKNMYIFTPYFKQIGILHDLQTIERLKVDGQDTIESRNEEQLLGKSVKKMTRIVTISNFTKKELLRYYNRDAEVVYNCVPNYLMGRPLGEKEIPSIVDKPYILDINSFKEYKNVDRLIHAFSAIKDKIPHLLYLKGAPDDEKYIDHLKDVISHEGITDRVIIDYVARDGDEIEYLYSHASLIISPSFMEGFGFAPIEGILHERPVLISNIETLVETTCGLVPSFDPNSIPQMAELMMSEINQPTPKSELSRRANVIKEKYTRKKQIKKLAEVIKDTCYGTES